MRHGYTRLGAGGYPVARVGQVIVKVVNERVNAIGDQLPGTALTRSIDESVTSIDLVASVGLAVVKTVGEVVTSVDLVDHLTPLTAGLVCSCDDIVINPLVDAWVEIAAITDATRLTIATALDALGAMVAPMVTASVEVAPTVEGQVGVTSTVDAEIDLTEFCD